MTISIDIDDKQIEKKKEKKSLFKKKPKQSIDKPTLNSNLKKKPNWKKITIISIIVLIAGLLLYGGYRLYKITKDIGFKLKPSDLVAQEKDPELKKDSTGKYTNVLLVGIDTRSAGGSLLNTDSIIFASFNYETKDITLVSIPRDFYVSLPDEFWFKKINSFYGYGEGLEEGGGLPMLQTKVEELLNQEIQYYAMIDLKGFEELIDALGGVYINVENSFTDYMYPAENDVDYQTVSFTAGPQTMDGATALKYARSRHSMDNGEGSDFARARRQQKVIEAVKKEVFDSGNYTNPQVLLDLINTVSENLTISEFTLEDIKAVLDISNNLQDGEGEIFSFVLDPNAGNGKIVTSKNVTTTNAYAIGPVLGLGQYTDIHDYVNKVLNNPGFYEEDASIYIYDTGLGYQNTYTKVLEIQELYPYSNIRFTGSLYYDKEGIIVYEHESGSKPETLSAFSTYLETELITQPEYITTNLNGEDISIFFGKPITVEEVVENE
jgi:LCP family protein required for cell wall assembly